MKITTRLTLEICDEIGVYREVERESREYTGPVALAKKGRKAQSANTGFQQGQANTYANNASGYNNDVNTIINEEIGNTTPGSMSPAASAMYSSDLANINNTYQGMRQNLYATAGTRGFGSAPSGFTQTSVNSINNAQGAAEQQAYNTGQENTQQERQNAAQTAAQMYGTSTQGELGNTNAATNSAYDQSRMGSTLGDIVGATSSILNGISGVGGILGDLQSGSGIFSGAGASPGGQTSMTPSTATMPNLSTQIPGLSTFGDPNATSQIAGLNTFNSNPNVAGSKRNTSGTGGY